MDKRILACAVCEKAFSRPFDLSQHNRTHTGEKPFGCLICDKKFAQKSNLIVHLKTHRVWPEALRTLQPVSDITSKRDKYCCQFCALECESYAACKKHISTYHSNEKVYKCLICSSQFPTVQELSKHKQLHQLENESAQSDHECKKCHAKFKRVDALRWHETMESHHHVCQVCNSVFMSERYLRRHLAIHGDPVRCPTCDKPLKNGISLRKHLFLHENEGGFACDHCEKRFPDAYRLRRHIAKHSEKPAHCSNRGKSYRKDKQIKTHQPVRSRISPKPSNQRYVCLPVGVTFFDIVGYVARVDGISMQPALNPWKEITDYVFLNKWAIRMNDISRGDVIALMSPKDPDQIIIKRLIGLEGDLITTNGYKSSFVRVPQGHCWVEGDHKGHSMDSNTFGPVALGLVTAKAMCIVWPPNRWQLLNGAKIQTDPNFLVQ